MRAAEVAPPALVADAAPLPALVADAAPLPGLVAEAAPLPAGEIALQPASTAAESPPIAWQPAEIAPWSAPAAAFAPIASLAPMAVDDDVAIFEAATLARRRRLGLAVVLATVAFALVVLLAALLR